LESNRGSSARSLGTVPTELLVMVSGGRNGAVSRHVSVGYRNAALNFCSVNEDTSDRHWQRQAVGRHSNLGLRNTNTSLELGAIPDRTDALFC
jgi:hypothetical protein